MGNGLWNGSSPLCITEGKKHIVLDIYSLRLTYRYFFNPFTSSGIIHYTSLNRSISNSRVSCQLLAHLQLYSRSAYAMVCYRRPSSVCR